MKRVSSGLLLALLLVTGRAGAQGIGVIGTPHNLSRSGPGEIRSGTEDEVCKFCHIAHTAVVPVPLWGHALSEVQDYKTPMVRSRGAAVRAPQPDGGSRLCLSCHDGTIAIGLLAKEIVAVNETFLRAGRKGYIGTDISGHHPISISIDESAPNSDRPGADMKLRPAALIRAAGDVPLDPLGKIQCTTCHDPHQDSYSATGLAPKFWRRPTVSEVCLECHEPR